MRHERTSHLLGSFLSSYLLATGTTAADVASADWIVEGEQESALFGRPVATAGDVNGDGYDDVIVGAFGHDNGQGFEGTAFVYHGSASGLATSPAWTAGSDQGAAWFAMALATAGDVNGDGYDDVIVGADRYDNGEAGEGRAFVYHGSALGLSTTAAWTAEPDRARSNFGNSVASAGDVNGDGYDDVVVGAYRYHNMDEEEGGAFVYYGSASGLATTPSWTAEGNQDFAGFGFSVAGAGDVNGDGYDDLIVGAYRYDNGEDSEGRVFVYHGSASGLSASPAWTGEGNQAFAQFGASVSTAGDVNGDGYDDVIVGADKYDNGETTEGRAFVYRGSRRGLKSTPIWTAEGDQESAFFGFSVASAGDVNGDGYDDVVIGAYGFDDVAEDGGRALVYYGSGSGLRRRPGWTAVGDQQTSWFGYSVATAGEVNGDGYDDVFIGQYLYDGVLENAGRAHVFDGSASGPSGAPD